MTTLFFNQVEEQVINQVNNQPTAEEILLSQADENVYLQPISDNTEFFAPLNEEKTKGITLEQLAKSSDIVNKDGELNNGINAYNLINTITNYCNSIGLNNEIKDLFVADNKNKALGNGISINKQLCQSYQEYNNTTNIPFSAVTFNRVFANINLTDFNNATHIANIVIATNQKGLQIAIGANCHACRNQTILGSKQMVTTYGKEKFKTLEDFINAAKKMIFEYSFEDDINKLEQMKRITIQPNEIYQIIGELTSIRVASDSRIKELNKLVTDEVAPFNNTQINRFTESLLLTYNRNKRLSLYDLYQSATALYKVASMDLPNVLPQNKAFAKFISLRYDLDLMN